jgi:hypothetical protein
MPTRLPPSTMMKPPPQRWTKASNQDGNNKPIKFFHH